MANQSNRIAANEFAGPLKYENNANPTIELYTNTALFLWKGREQTEERTYIISMPSFLKRLRNMENAISQDDPWADRTYYQLQLVIDEAEHALRSKKQTLDELLTSGHRRLTFPDSVTTRPIVMEIAHHSRLGWRACDVLLAADDIAKLVMQAHHRGRIGKRENRVLIKEIETAVRRMMSVVARWKYSGVTRDDVAANTQPAQAAKSSMGDIEQEFLDGDLRSNFAPNLPARRAAVIPEEDVISKEDIQAAVDKINGSTKPEEST